LDLAQGLGDLGGVEPADLGSHPDFLDYMRREHDVENLLHG